MPSPGRRTVTITLMAIALVLLGVSNNINGGGDRWRTVLQADAKGYYAYLPAIFVHHDLHFGFLERADSIASTPALHYDYRTAPTGTPANKYWSGTALLQAPFFLITHAAMKASGGVADGHGRPYVLAVCIAAIAYALLGLWALARLLATYGVSPWMQVIVLVFIQFGTHLFYYTIVAPGMSHVYSFALMGLFFLEGRQWALQPTARHLVALGTLLGLLVLVRPVNGLAVLALPFLAETWPRLLDALSQALKSPVALGSSVVACALIAGIQLLLYHQGTGYWWIDSYAGEGFNWGDPHLFDILFSYRKGLFVYTPMCLLALIGLRPMYRQHPFAAFAWIGFLALLTYVLSSWWSWWYGGSFSARPYVEYLPLFAIPLGIALQRSGGMLRTTLLTTGLLAMVICQVQTYQARYYQIHYENMDRERYWEVFLRVDRIP